MIAGLKGCKIEGLADSCPRNPLRRPRRVFRRQRDAGDVSEHLRSQTDAPHLLLQGTRHGLQAGVLPRRELPTWLLTPSLIIRAVVQPLHHVQNHGVVFKTRTWEVLTQLSEAENEERWLSPPLSFFYRPGETMCFVQLHCV